MSPPKVKSFKRDTSPAHRLVMRSVVVRADTLDDAGKAVQAVIASEHPVERWDEERGEVVQEILLMSGMRFRDGRPQLPIADSHDRSTVRNVLGSIRNIRVEGDELVGDVNFARDTDSQDAFYKVIDGHITDFSITADPKELVMVKRGDTAVFGDREFAGPANVITRWEPSDASLVAAGADIRSKIRRSYDISKEGIARAMSPETIAALVAKGMPSDLTDPEQIMAWVMGHLSAGEAEAVATEPVMSMDEPVVPEEEEEAAPVENMDEEEEKPAEEIENMEDDEEEVKKSVGRALKYDQKRRNEIQAICKQVGIERAFADELCDSGVSLDIARDKVIKRMATTPLGTSVGGDVRVTKSADDKFNNAVRDGLLIRAQAASRVNRKLVENASAGAEDFKHMSLLRLAEEALRRAGGATHRFAAPEIARAAIGDKEILRRMGIRRDAAYHTTGSFPNLMLDAANKTLLAGYEEAPYTWTLWARQATSVDDFKNVNRMRFSESPDLEEVAENEAYPEGQMSDSKETYHVGKFGKKFTVSWETVVNDDLDAISRIPAMHGNAARRTQNKKVYEVLTGNPMMGDGKTLFASNHASGSNVSGAAAAPSVTTLNAAYVKMRTQKGLNTDVTINVIPRFLIVPVAYEATALELVNSISYNAANNNEGVRNIYGPGGSRNLTVIGEPVLDGNSATIWYLAADPGQLDTVELVFLAGEESPVLTANWDDDHDCYKYKIRQSFGVKAIDWRGLYRNAA